MVIPGLQTEKEKGLVLNVSCSIHNCQPLCCQLEGWLSPQETTPVIKKNLCRYKNKTATETNSDQNSWDFFFPVWIKKIR